VVISEYTTVNESTVVGLKNPGGWKQVVGWNDNPRRGGYGLTGSTEWLVVTVSCKKTGVTVKQGFILIGFNYLLLCAESSKLLI